MQAQPATPGEQLRHLLFGYRVSQAIGVAAELGIADVLGSGPRSAEELARATGVDGPSLSRVLRLLASEGVFAETEDGRFALTPMAEALRSDVPGSLRPLAVFNSGEPYWRSWAHLAHAVRTGQPAFEHVHGMDFFSYYRQHPEEWALFDQMMAAQTAAVTRTVAAAYDFSRVRTVVDVGGGNGTLVLGLLAAHPHLHGVVFDQPAVAARAEEAIAAAGLADRCQAVGGDFFVAVPEGGEAYLLKYILHDWDDERSIAILRACRQAMPADGRLLVIELLIPPGNNPSYAKSQDVNMLTNLGGRERTVEEYGTLFTAAGFALTETVPIQGELHLIEGAPA
jgi:hypothetical protein